jgi:hypothetical protein
LEQTRDPDNVRSWDIYYNITEIIHYDEAHYDIAEKLLCRH